MKLIAALLFSVFSFSQVPEFEEPKTKEFTDPVTSKKFTYIEGSQYSFYEDGEEHPRKEGLVYVRRNYESQDGIIIYETCVYKEEELDLLQKV